ncbi:hypothetical protein D9757_014273 [Collybiopsis confluens]|uniref:TIP41-like protein n=1 Tax=Collybiopsis confluens TaxID=2823264 RepID=A0A8H5FRI1_9AGAR|nr:hypothetical protein D9757_014273 [Collybiopsis confluens]
MSTPSSPAVRSMESTRPTPPPFQNPIMKPAVKLPKHTLLESPNARTILIGCWRITATTHPISNSMECDQLQAELRRLGQASEAVGVTLPLPEMTFGNNLLKMEYRADGKFESKSAEVDSDLEDEDEGGDIVERRRGKSDWLYQFDTLHALLAVKTGELEAGDGGVKVNYAEEWLKNRTGPSPRLPMPKTVPTTPYDWTYTTSYQGHSPSDAPQSLTSSMASMSLTPDSSLRSNRPHWYPSSTSPSPSQTTIPLAELTRPDPILFYAEVPLFEDELHDNGSSAVVVRIRVMPTCIFILSRFTLRVDGVLFRTFDTRLYSSLEYEGQGEQSPMVIRETSGWEAPYESVRAVSVILIIFPFLLLLFCLPDIGNNTHRSIPAASQTRRPHSAY